MVGAVVFAEVIAETSKKVYDFFKQMQEGPAKIASAFRGVNAPLQATNDELRVFERPAGE